MSRNSSSLVEIYELLLRDHLFLSLVPSYNLVVGTLTVLLNSVTWRFYRTRASSPIHLIYFVLASADWLVGVSLVLQAVCIMAHSLSDTSLIYTTPLFYLLANISLKTSAMYTVILTIARSINIIFPVYQLNRARIKTAVVVVPVYWSCIALLELLLSRFLLMPGRYVGTRNHTILTVKDTMVVPRTGTAVVNSLVCETYLTGDYCLNETKIGLDIANIVLTQMLPYGLPILVCFVSTGYQTLHILYRKRKVKMRRLDVRITQTIVLLTLSFLTCGSVHFALNFALSVRRVAFTITWCKVMLVTCYPLLGLNSLVTPLVLCCRGTTLKKYVKMRLWGRGCKVRTGRLEQQGGHGAGTGTGNGVMSHETYM